MNSDLIWWEGPGLYAPRQEGTHEDQHTRWYRVEGREDARAANLGTPRRFETTQGMQTLPYDSGDVGG